MKIHLKTDFRGAPPRPFRRTNGKYYIRIWCGGHDVWRSCRTTKLSEANNLAYEIWYNQQQNSARSLLARPENSLVDDLRKYPESAGFADLSNSTKHMRIIYLKTFIDFCTTEHILYLSQLTPALCEKLLDVPNRSNKTYNNIRGDMIKIVGSVVSLRGGTNPFSVLPRRSLTKGVRASKIKAAFTDAQIRQILSDLIRFSD